MTQSLWASRIAESQRVVDQVIKLNNSSTIDLVLRGPLKVFTGRFIAANLGRGVAGASVPVLGKTVQGMRMMLEGLNTWIFRRIFMSGGRLNFLHPSWLLRRSSRLAVLACLGSGEQRLAIIGADAGFIREIEEDRPGLSVVPLGEKTVSYEFLGRLAEKLTVGIALQASGGEPKEPPAQLITLSQLGLKCYVLQTSDHHLSKHLRIGGLGTHLCSFWPMLQKWLHRHVVATGGLIGAIVRFTILLATPLLYLLVATLGLVLNSLGMLLDRPTVPSSSAEPTGREALAAHEMQKERQG
jgi:hypothetical protein